MWQLAHDIVLWGPNPQNIIVYGCLNNVGVIAHAWSARKIVIRSRKHGLFVSRLVLDPHELTHPVVHLPFLHHRESRSPKPMLVSFLVAWAVAVYT